MYRPNAPEETSVIFYIAQSLFMIGFNSRYVDFQMTRIFFRLQRRQQSTYNGNQSKHNPQWSRCWGVPQGPLHTGRSLKVLSTDEGSQSTPVSPNLITLHAFNMIPCNLELYSARKSLEKQLYCNFSHLILLIAPASILQSKPNHGSYCLILVTYDVTKKAQFMDQAY